MLTPAAMPFGLCEERGYERVALVVAHALREDLHALDAVESRGSAVDAVIVGDLGRGFTWDVMNGAFRSRLRGARPHRPAAQPLLAAQPEGLVLDAGAFIAAGVRRRPARHRRRQALGRFFFLRA